MLQTYRIEMFSLGVCFTHPSAQPHTPVGPSLFKPTRRRIRVLPDQREKHGGKQGTKERNQEGSPYLSIVQGRKHTNQYSSYLPNLTYPYHLPEWDRVANVGLNSCWVPRRAIVGGGGDSICSLISQQ